MDATATLVAVASDPDDAPELCSICGESICAGDIIVQPNMQDVAHSSCAEKAVAA